MMNFGEWVRREVTSQGKTVAWLAKEMEQINQWSAAGEQEAYQEQNTS